MPRKGKTPGNPENGASSDDGIPPVYAVWHKAPGARKGTKLHPSACPMTEAARGSEFPEAGDKGPKPGPTRAKDALPPESRGKHKD